MERYGYNHPGDARLALDRARSQPGASRIDLDHPALVTVEQDILRRKEEELEATNGMIDLALKAASLILAFMFLFSLFKIK